MGDLFDGYGSTLAPRKTASGVPAFDEMFGVPAHPGAPVESREAYRELYQALAQMTQDELRGRTESLASSYLAQGVTFDFAGEERPFPLDAVPRVIDVRRVVARRVGRQAARARARGVPRRRLRSPALRARRGAARPGSSPRRSTSTARQPASISANGVRIQVSGIDLIRDENGEMRVLEDNVRVPSRRQLRHLEPPRDGADAARAVRLDAGAPGRRLPEQAARGAAGVGARRRRRPERRRAHARCLQLRVLRAHAARAPDGRRARRGPRPALRRRQGVHAHDRAAPSASTSSTAASTTSSSTRCSSAPTRCSARPGSCSPRASATSRSRTRSATASPTTSSLYTYVPDLIRYYLAEEPILKNVDTWRLEDPGRARRGARPARRARRQARRRLGRQGPRRRAGCLARRARRSSASACSPIRAAGSRSRSSCSRRSRPSSRTGCARATPTCARSRSTTARTSGCCPAASPASRCPRASSSSTPARAAARRTPGSSAAPPPRTSSTGRAAASPGSSPTRPRRSPASIPIIYDGQPAADALAAGPPALRTSSSRSSSSSSRRASRGMRANAERHPVAAIGDRTDEDGAAC